MASSSSPVGLHGRPQPSARQGPSIEALLIRPRFELVPLASAEEEAGCLAAGTTVTISCSPRRGIDATVILAERLAPRRFRIVPHLAARTVRGREHLREVVARMTAAGVEDVFVIGGDSPSPVGPYRSALELLEAIAELGQPFSQVGIAGYPEPHPLIGRKQLDQALAAKQNLATYVVTQMCFDPATIFEWLVHIRQRGISLPVHIGMPGAVVRWKLLEIARRVGVGDSLRYLTKQGDLFAKVMWHQDYRPDGLIAQLAPYLGNPELNVAGFHINTFNQVRRTEKWRQHALAVHGPWSQSGEHIQLHSGRLQEQ